MYDILTRDGDILFTDADFHPADDLTQIQNILRNVIFTRRGSLPYNTTYGSDLLHNKAANELGQKTLAELAKYITDDILYSVWLVNPVLANNLRAEYVLDEENKTITWRLRVKTQDVFVPISLNVATLNTQLGIRLVFE